MEKSEEVTLRSLLDGLKNLEGDGYTNTKTGATKPNLISFSDTIIATYPIDQNVISSANLSLLCSYARQIQERFLLKLKLLTRGVLHIGKMVHTNGIVYGKGLIEAYEFEQKIDNPIIIISPELRKHNIFNTLLPYEYFNYCGMNTISYLHYYAIIKGNLYDKEFRETQQIIKKCLKKYKCCKEAKRKWTWFSTFFEEINKIREQSLEPLNTTILKNLSSSFRRYCALIKQYFFSFFR